MAIWILLKIFYTLLSNEKLPLSEDRMLYRERFSLQHVLKPESTTTPLRIVTNSSLPDRNGNSVNSILMKGPNSLSDQRAVVSQ